MQCLVEGMEWFHFLFGWRDVMKRKHTPLDLLPGDPHVRQPYPPLSLLLDVASLRRRRPALVRAYAHLSSIGLVSTSICPASAHLRPRFRHLELWPPPIIRASTFPSSSQNPIRASTLPCCGAAPSTCRRGAELWWPSVHTSAQQIHAIGHVEQVNKKLENP